MVGGGIGVFAWEVLLRIDSEALEPSAEEGEYTEDPGVFMSAWLLFRFPFEFGVATVGSTLRELSVCFDSSRDGEGLFAGTKLAVLFWYGLKNSCIVFLGFFSCCGEDISAAILTCQK